MSATRLSCATARLTLRPASATRPRLAAGLRVSCSAVSLGGPSAPSADVAVGAKVKVKEKVVVFHVPKQAKGVDLTGMTGTMEANVEVYKGVTLSATFPYKCVFMLEGEGGKPVKCIAHLRKDEFDVL